MAATYETQPNARQELSLAAYRAASRSAEQVSHAALTLRNVLACDDGEPEDARDIVVWLDTLNEWTARLNTQTAQYLATRDRNQEN